MTYRTNAERLHAQAVNAGIPLRTLDQVKAELAADAKRDPKIAKTMARLMLRYGRLTDEARAYVTREYPQGV